MLYEAPVFNEEDATVSLRVVVDFDDLIKNTGYDWLDNTIAATLAEAGHQRLRIRDHKYSLSGHSDEGSKAIVRVVASYEKAGE